jgi:hypothetical protein
LVPQAQISDPNRLFKRFLNRTILRTYRDRLGEVGRLEEAGEAGEAGRGYVTLGEAG